MKSAQKGNLLIILAIAVALSAAGFLYFKSKSSDLVKSTPNVYASLQPAENNSTSNSEQSKEYNSNGMDLTIMVPLDFEIQDQSTRILLNNSRGQIIISRSGTQFDSLDSYLADLDSKNKNSLVTQEGLFISSYSAKVRTSSSDKQYRVMVDGWVYTLSTSSETLYDDLDQIAQSFRYTP